MSPSVNYPTRIIWGIMAALIGAIGAMMLVLIPWFFFGLAKWPEQFGLPRLTLTWTLLGAGVIGAVIGFVKECWRQQRIAERTAANRELADRLRLTFDASPSRLDWPPELLAAVHEGQQRGTSQRLHGHFGGMPLEVADIAYIIHSNDSEGGSTTGEHTVFAWNVGEQSLPNFTIRRRNWGTGMSLVLLGADACVSFDAAAVAGPAATVVQEFDRRFIVLVRPQQASAVAAVRRICAPPVMQALLDLGELQLTSCGGWLALWQPGAILSGEKRERLIRQSHSLIKLLLGSLADYKSAVVPADPRALVNAQWSLLPLGCAFAAATPAFFLGVFATFPVVILGGKVPMFLFPLAVFGTMFLGIGLGWACGTWLQRLYRER